MYKMCIGFSWENSWHQKSICNCFSFFFIYLFVIFVILRVIFLHALLKKFAFHHLWINAFSEMNVVIFFVIFFFIYLAFFAFNHYSYSVIYEKKLHSLIIHILLCNTEMKVAIRTAYKSKWDQPFIYINLCFQ